MVLLSLGVVVVFIIIVDIVIVIVDLLFVNTMITLQLEHDISLIRKMFNKTIHITIP